jgi:hypothetical protein
MAVAANPVLRFGLTPLGGAGAICIAFIAGMTTR